MDGRGRTFLLLQVFSCFIVFASTEETKQISQKEIEDCSQVQCPGPLTYYHDVGCTPVYKKEEDCCAYKYNCEHLDARSRNKCYVKNRSYENGESYAVDENHPCHTCNCRVKATSARFDCTYLCCLAYKAPHGCYYDNKPGHCCVGPIICPKNGSKIPECVVDGVTYKGGEYFTPKNDPWKRCSCRKGYTGDNIEPFCITPSTRCSTDLYHNEDIANKCAPTYDSDQNPATSCSPSWRCQHSNDTVIPNPNGTKLSAEKAFSGEDLTCKFGNLTMHLGDKLSQNTGSDSECVRCVCEVPPTPTCKRLGYYDCSSGDNSPSGESL